MTLFYEDNFVTLFNADCRDHIGNLTIETVITDPVWPNSTDRIIGHERPFELFREMNQSLPQSVKRIAVHLGCNSDPAILAPVQLTFFRTCWLEYVRPHYLGRLMYGSDVAYLYGEPPVSKPGQHVIPGRITDADSGGKQSNHPCPRKLNHVSWLVKWWSEDNDTILDPFAGSGTTLIAAKLLGRKCVGFEVDKKHCKEAKRRLRQGVFEFTEST